VVVTAAGVAEITLTKTTTAANVELHDWVNYTLTAENTGAATLTNVSIADALPGVTFVGPCDPATLAPGATLTCTARYQVTQTDMDAGTVLNDATVTGTPPSGPDVTDSASATVTTLDAPAIGVNVTVSPTKYKRAGQVLVFQVVTTNTGTVTLFHTVLDTYLLGADTSACDAVDVTLAPGESVTCTVTYVVAPADLYLEELVLGVHATGESHTAVSVTASAATGALPDLALAATGADAVGQSRYALSLVLAGLFLMLLARRYRREEEDA
jgi:uncharacterized repeat protein (TIGR01451 family)